MVKFLDKDSRCFVCVLDYRDVDQTRSIVYEGELGLEIIGKDGKKYQMINISENGGFQIKFPFVKNMDRSAGATMSIMELQGTIFNVMWKNARQLAMVVKDDSEIDEAMEFLINEFMSDKANALGITIEEIKRQEETYNKLPFELKEEYSKALALKQDNPKYAKSEIKRVSDKIRDYLLVIANKESK